jgi:hypothetical protein
MTRVLGDEGVVPGRSFFRVIEGPLKGSDVREAVVGYAEGLEVVEKAVEAWRVQGTVVTMG